MIGRTLGHYKVVAKLGEGGMGEVYAAQDTRLGRKVAIKSLPAALGDDPERLRRFTQEAKAASALNHPSILTIYDVDDIDGHPFLVTEFIEGQTLRARLRQGGLGRREAIEIAGQVASALAAAHAAGIVHRDVKPENIMLREDGHAKLVDFGLAKLEHDASGSGTDETVAAAGPRTTPGLVMGTTPYMSPEQARGLPVDARSDIFSLGVVLYEMAAGRPPFQGETPSDVIAAILRVEPPPIADLPPDLEHTLRKALEKDRDERYQTAKDLAADLKRLGRRLDPAGGATPTPIGGAAAAWTPTPHGSGAGTSATTPAGATAASPTAPASGATAPTSRRLWLVVAAVAALVVIGVLAVMGPRFLRGEAGAGDRGGAGQLGHMTIERVSGLGEVNTPAISQDGRLLAYVRTEAAENAIWLRQMATGSVVRVVGPTPNTISNLQFTPDGNFLYYSENTTTRPIRYTLMAAPAFGGTAREVAEGRFLSRPSFAPDGKRFVAMRETATAWEVVVMNADGRGAATTIGTRPKSGPGFSSPSWSPSGMQLAILVGERVASGIQTNIQIMKPDGSEPRTLTPPPGTRIVHDLSWAANDESLLATGRTGMSSPAQLLQIRASDGRIERITNDANDYFGLSFSRPSGLIATVQTVQLGSIWIGPVDRPEDAREVPGRLSEKDGIYGLCWLNDQQLVFTRETDFPSLWMMNADGSRARRLTEGSISVFPRASKDGHVVVFESVRDNANLPNGYRMTMPDGRVARITSESGTTGFAVSPDGRTVFFRRVIETPARLLRTATDGGEIASVFEAPTIFDSAVSPDGTRIAVTANSGVGTPRTVSLLPTGGGDARTIFTTGAALEYIRWYPSGNALLLLIGENRQWNMARLDLASGQARPLTRFTRGLILNPEISPDGRRIAYYRGTTESDIVLVKPKVD